MDIGYAKSAARDWVKQCASEDSSFLGAYFSGSTIDKPDEAEMGRFSDVDVMVVTSLGTPPSKLGKFLYKGALLEVTYIAQNQLASAEEVLTSYHLANALKKDTVIADPTGFLHALQAEVSRHFAERAWVRRRCMNAMEKVKDGLRHVGAPAPFYDQVTSWLFPTGVMTHVLLVAALQNPTVRLRYAAARALLEAYGRADFYEELINLLGCEQLSPRRLEKHLDELAITFDLASGAAKTPFFFSSDITSAAWPIAIDASREMIHSGSHREAVFWMVATFARCHKILAADAPPDVQRMRMPAFLAMLADLGIESPADLIRRAEEAESLLPALETVAEEILLQSTANYA